MRKRVIGIDTGGTFTDFVLRDGARLWLHKVPSTPDDFARGVLEGVQTLLRATPTRAGDLLVVHGTTVATNALLERTGARVALITTRGFRDVLELGRQQRAELYNLQVDRPPPLVPRARRLEVHERVEVDGSVSVALTEEELARVLEAARQTGAETLALCLLFSFLRPGHEIRLARAARAGGWSVSRSSEIAPEFREYERTSTTVANAYVTPVMAGYLRRLQRRLRGRGGGATVLQIMQSNGGMISAPRAAAQPVRTLLSGPAAGVLGAFAVARQSGFDRIITLDMGGTSTDVSLCEGSLRRRPEGEVAGLPVRIPMLDLHTVGAGGGSVARIDAGGALRVGPESAGADPGPACYGRGELPTVTDANLVLERILPAAFLQGRMTLQPEASRRVIGRLAQAMGCSLRSAAEAVIAVANSNMEQALRRVSLERGHDPRSFTLVAFGGAGGLHACQLAEALAIPSVLIPVHPGNLCAWGCLVADTVIERSLTILQRKRVAKTLIARSLARLQRETTGALRREGIPRNRLRHELALDLRYCGQSFELEVPWRGSLERAQSDFHRRHREAYGQSAPGEPVEVVNVRVRTIARSDRPRLPRLARGRASVPATAYLAVKPLTAYRREQLLAGNRFLGPAVVVEDYATTYLPLKWQCRVDLFGNLVLTRT